MDRCLRLVLYLPRILLFTMLMAFGAAAQSTIHVPADQPTIQAAINAASPGDTVVVAPGTYVENIDFLGKAITVTSSDGAQSTIIDGNMNGPAVQFVTGEPETAILDGFTITHASNNTSYPSGAVRFSNSSATLRNNIITGNLDCVLGGVSASNSSPQILNNTISNNGQFTPWTSCQSFSSGFEAGGIAIQYSLPGVQTQVVGNTVISNGTAAAIALQQAGNAVLRGNLVKGNFGGVSVSIYSSETVIDNVIVDNSLAPDLYIPALYIDGFQNQNQPGMYVVNNTLSGDSQSQPVVNLNYFFDTVHLVNNIILGNGGPSIYCEPVFGSTAPILANNDVYSTNSTSLYSGICTDQTGVNGNIWVDPAFVDAAHSDYHLQASSPLIDTGSNTAADLPDVDVESHPRVVDGNNDGSSLVDIGAYEFVPQSYGQNAVLSPALARFPNQNVNTTSTPIMVTLTNTGTADLAITGISTSGPFAETNNCTEVLSVGAHCVFAVTFTPTAGGRVSGSLTVVTGTGPVSAALVGTGNFAAGRLSPSTLNFYDVLLGNYWTQSLTLRSTGTVPLIINSIDTSSPFSIVGGACIIGMSLSPGAACDIQVQFTPTQAIAYSGAVTVSTTAPDPLTSNLIGSGSAPVASISPTILSFSPQVVGTTSAAQAVTVSNTGNSVLTISQISIPAPFSQTNNCGGYVLAGSSCTILVTYSPLLVQADSGSLVISHNAAGGPSTVVLTGSGIGPSVSVSPTSLSFDSQLLGTISATQSFTVSNTGAIPLPLTNISATAPFSQTNNCPSTLAAGSSCTVQVTFSPVSRGTATGVVDVTLSLPTPSLLVNLSGTAVGAPNTIYVPSDQPNIQAAIGAASPGDIVLVFPGTYAENINFLGKAITAASVKGAATTIINGGGRAPVVTFKNGESASSVLDGFTLQNGFEPSGNGGGVKIDGASPTVRNNIITHNNGPWMSAVWARSSSAIIQHNTITGNGQLSAAQGSGGMGAGISLLGGSPQLLDNTISGNTMMNGSGGGLVLWGTNAALISNNVIRGNTAGNGGAVYMINGPTGTFVGNLIVGNTAPSHPGIYAGAASNSLAFVNNTIADNLASDKTGAQVAIDFYMGGTTLANNIITARGSDPAVSCSSSTSPAPSFQSNDVYSPTASGPYGGTCSDQTGVNGSISIDPFFIDVPNGDYHVAANSHVIDSGANNPSGLNVNLPATDLEGNPRIGDGNNDGNAVIDLGAYEHSPSNASGPLVSLNTTSVVFPTQYINTTSAVRKMVITNAGNADLLVSSINITGPFAQGNSCATAIPAGMSCPLSVTFTPTAVGTFSGLLLVTSNAANSPAAASLTGVGVTPPAVEITPAQITFASVQVGTGDSRIFTLANRGGSPLTITSVTIGGAPFLVSSGCPAVLRPNDTCIIGAGFLPTQTGTFNDVVTITDNAANSPQTVPVTGNATPPPISYSPASLNFLQRIGTTSAPQTVTITNSSSSPLAITGVSTYTPFAQTNTCPASLPAAASCMISVTFSPTIPGTASSSVLVQYTGGSTTIPVSGSAVQPIAFLSPTSLSFGPVAVGSTLAKTVGLTSSGDGVLNISAINVSGPDFHLQSTSCGATLAPSASCTINIIYTPTARGSGSGSLTVTHDASGSPSTIPLSGTGIAPVFGISPATISFGSVIVGASANQTVTVSNTGDAPLNFSSITTASPFSQSSNCGTLLAANASCTITITFQPTARGIISGNLVINHNAAGSPSTVSLSGTGIAPVASVSPSSLAFGNQLVGSTSVAQAITLSNTGDWPLTITAIAFSTGSAPFAQTNNCGTSLAAGATCTINVTFVPTSRGSASGNMTVIVGAPAANQTVALSGNGVAPVASLSPTSITFALQRANTTSTPQALTLSNTGDSGLTISSIVATGLNSFAQTNNCPGTLAPGTSCSINVTFQPTQSGPYQSSVVITNNSGGASGSTQTISLSGTGGASTANVSPLSLAFPTTKVGASAAPMGVTISNSGTMVLNISSISASGDFSQSNNCGAVVAPGASCIVNVVFQPIGTGSRSGTLTINDDAQSVPVQTVSLSGAAAVPTASVAPGTLTFGTLPAGTQSSASIVTLSNTGVVAMNMASIATTGDFIQSNNCSTTLAAGSSCTINVIFAPSAGGTRTGLLTITDDASGGSQTVSLSGSATDFAVTVSPTSVIINAGQSANYNAKVSAVGGVYNQTVSLTCSGVPAGATCTFTPVSVIPGSTSQTAKLKITTSNGGTPKGTYTIVVSGVVNSAVRTGTATLIVK